MSEDVTRVVRDEPPDDRGRGTGDGGRSWMVVTVALVALLVGLGAGLLLNSGDEQTRTVHRTVTAAAGSATTGDPVTVTQRNVTTIERTVTAAPETETVTVTVPGETATDDGAG